MIYFFIFILVLAFQDVRKEITMHIWKDVTIAHFSHHIILTVTTLYSQLFF